MKKGKMKITELYQNNFDQTKYLNKQMIQCDIDEFNEMLLNKEYLIVAIKRNDKSEFLFHGQQSNYLTENAKYIIFNFKYGLEEATFTEKLDNNERNLNQLEII